MSYSIKPLEPSEFKPIYKRIQKDFAMGEYAPYFVLSRQLREGTQQGFLFLDDETPVAYAICAQGDVNANALISLFAAFAEHRARGYGSAFLRMLVEHYRDLGLNGMYVEVEKPECAKNDAEKETRLRRIRFYESAGFRLVDGIEYSIWDVPMHLMALPLAATEQDVIRRTGEAMHDLYLKLMGKRFIHKMKLKTSK